MRSGVDQLEKIGPGFVQVVFPFGDSGGIRMSGTHQLISDLVDGSHTFGTDCFCVSGEFLDIFKMGGKKLTFINHSRKLTCNDCLP